MISTVIVKIAINVLSFSRVVPGKWQSFARKKIIKKSGHYDQNEYIDEYRRTTVQIHMKKKLYRRIRSIDEKANTHKCTVYKKKVIIQEYLGEEKEWNEKFCVNVRKKKERFVARKENILKKEIFSLWWREGEVNICCLNFHSITWKKCSWTSCECFATEAKNK